MVCKPPKIENPFCGLHLSITYHSKNSLKKNAIAKRRPIVIVFYSYFNTRKNLVLHNLIVALFLPQLDNRPRENDKSA